MDIQLKTLAVTILLAGLLSACSTTPEAGAETLAADPDRIICRTGPDTGSRLANRVCKRASDWERIAEENLEQRRNLQRGAIGGEGAVERGKVN